MKTKILQLTAQKYKRKITRNYCKEIYANRLENQEEINIFLAHVFYQNWGTKQNKTKNLSQPENKTEFERASQQRKA